MVFSEAHLTLRKGDHRRRRRRRSSPPPTPPATSSAAPPSRTPSRSPTTAPATPFGIEVADLLAINGDGIGGQDATCAQITAISPGGACAGDDITWTDLAIPAGGSIRLTYTWTLPRRRPGGDELAQRGRRRRVPLDHDDRHRLRLRPSQQHRPRPRAEANTDPARDDAQLFSPGLSLSKTRTTAIAEPGNAAADQATIGEVISFTVEARQSAGTVITDAVLTDDLRGRGLTLVAGSAEARSAPAAPGAPCDVSGATPLPAFPAIPGIRVTGDLIEIIGPAGDLATSTDDLCVVLTFRAVVQDAPNDAGEALVRRPGVVTNEAIVTFDADPSASVAPRTVRARVDTQVVEPNLSIDKQTASDDTVFPGAQVPYQLVVTNRSAAQVATAHDLVVTDDFSASAVVTIVDNPDGGVVAGTTITWTLPADPDGDGVAGLSPGASVALEYTVTLQSPLVAGDLLTNTATVVGASLPAAAPGARTAASACSPAECPGYVDDDSLTLTVDGPRVEKTPILPLDTIGGLQGYLVQAILPANLDFGPAAVTLTDDLAGGATTFVDTISVVCLGCTDAERAEFARARGERHGRHRRASLGPRRLRAEHDDVPGLHRLSHPHRGRSRAQRPGHAHQHRDAGLHQRLARRRRHDRDRRTRRLDRQARRRGDPRQRAARDDAGRSGDRHSRRADHLRAADHQQRRVDGLRHRRDRRARLRCRRAGAARATPACWPTGSPAPPAPSSSTARSGPVTPASVGRFRSCSRADRLHLLPAARAGGLPP